MFANPPMWRQPPLIGFSKRNNTRGRVSVSVRRRPGVHGCGEHGAVLCKSLCELRVVDVTPPPDALFCANVCELILSGIGICQLRFSGPKMYFFKFSVLIKNVPSNSKTSCERILVGQGQNSVHFLLLRSRTAIQGVVLTGQAPPCPRVARENPSGRRDGRRLPGWAAP